MKTNKMNAIAYGLLVLVFLLWGSLYVVSSQVLQQLSAFTVLFLRFFIAWIFLSIVSGLKKDKPRKIAAEDKKYLYMLAIGGYTAAVGLQLIGVKLVGSTTASLINSMNPVFISVFAVFLLKEKLTFNKVLGIVLTVVGAYIIIGGNSIDPIKSAVSIGATLLWAATSVMTRKGLAGYDAIYVTKTALGYASVFSFIFALVEISIVGMPSLITAGCVIRLLYMAIGCTAIPYFLWNYALAKLPAANCSAFYPLQPVCSAVMGILIFHEEIGMEFWMGSLLIVAGILTTLLLTTNKEKRVKTGRLVRRLLAASFMVNE